MRQQFLDYLTITGKASVITLAIHSDLLSWVIRAQAMPREAFMKLLWGSLKLLKLVDTDIKATSNNVPSRVVCDILGSPKLVYARRISLESNLCRPPPMRYRL
jgi:hypothetical protein